MAEVEVEVPTPQAVLVERVAGEGVQPEATMAVKVPITLAEAEAVPGMPHIVAGPVDMELP